jgi:CHRD domain
VRNTRILTGAAGLLVALGSAQAQTLHFNFVIEGSQLVPPVAGSGVGVGDVFLDTQTNEVRWNIGFTQLSGPAVAAHFHGPAPIGANAAIQVDIGAVSGLFSPMIGTTTISAAQSADLQAGLWYVNIHTALNPTGEIRGQVIPAPGALMVLAGAGLFATRRRR